MLEPRGEQRLALEARAQIRMLRAQQLERDRSLQPPIMGREDPPHAAAGDLDLIGVPAALDRLERAPLGAGRARQRRRDRERGRLGRQGRQVHPGRGCRGDAEVRGRLRGGPHAPSLHAGTCASQGEF